MTWIQIAELILKLVGPILGELINKWLEKLLNKTAAKLAVAVPFPADLAPEQFDEEGMSLELLDAALADIPRRQVLRRAIVRGLIDSVPETIARGDKKLPKADANELKALAAKMAADEAK